MRVHCLSVCRSAMSAQLRLGAMFAEMRARGAGEAEADAPLGKMQRFAEPEKQCAHAKRNPMTGKIEWQCKWHFPVADEHAWCKTCLAKATKEK